MGKDTKDYFDFPVHFEFQIDPADIVTEFGRALNPEDAMRFVRLLDQEMADWDFSDMLIAYGKELEKLREKEPDLDPQDSDPNNPPKYKYHAKTADGRDVHGTRDADTVGALVADLKRDGLIVINVEDNK